jgi:hypothetical protein
LAYPIAFPFDSIKNGPQRLRETHEVLSLVLNQFPTPADDVPLEDLIAFKRDSRIKFGFDKFWRRTQSLAREGLDRQEQINWLTHPRPATLDHHPAGSHGRKELT